MPDPHIEAMPDPQPTAGRIVTPEEKMAHRVYRLERQFELLWSVLLHLPGISEAMGAAMRQAVATQAPAEPLHWPPTSNESGPAGA